MRKTTKKYTTTDVLLLPFDKLPTLILIQKKM